MTTQLRAILWDLDGTLIDSEPYWMRSEIELAAEHGGTWTMEDAAACIGNSLEVTAQRMQARGVPLSTPEVSAALFARMEQLVRTDGLPYRPGALELVEEAQAAGVVQALVTMSYGPYVAAAAESVPAGALSAVRMGDSVERGKPAPDIYLAAMADLGLEPADCLAIEDSGPGGHAIFAAGVTPVVVPGEGEVPELPGVLRWPTLAGVDLAHLRATHTAYQAGVTAGRAAGAGAGRAAGANAGREAGVTAGRVPPAGR